MSMLPAPGERPGLPSLPILGEERAQPAMLAVDMSAAPRAPGRRLPEWLKRPIPATGGMSFTRSLVAELGLETVCESARCPNRSECWTRRTATFMILGDVCTRPCGFCSVKRGRPEEVALDEPERLAEACRAAGPAPRGHHVGHSRRSRRRRGRALSPVRAGRPRRTGATIEVLTPDFDGRGERDRYRPLGQSRGLQPQPRNRRPPPATRAGARASTRSASVSSSTSRKRGLISARRAV